MRRLAFVAIAGWFMVFAMANTADAQDATRCATLFPEAEWVAGESSILDIGFSAVPEGRAERFTAEIEATAAAVSSDIGGLEGSAVCVVGSDSAFDPAPYIERTKRFHAVLDHDNDVLLLSAASPGNIERAAAFGVPHLALWNLSGGVGWPEPLASTIGQWYRAVALDRMAQYRVQSTGADFSVDPITGEGNFGLDFSTEARIAWTESTQPALRTWDPSRNDAPIGYFIEYTVASEGPEVLADTDADTWQGREALWRQSLVSDLTGRTEPTTGWISGISLAVAVLVVAAVLAIGGFVMKRRRNRRRIATG